MKYFFFVVFCLCWIVVYFLRQDVVHEQESVLPQSVDSNQTIKQDKSSIPGTDSSIQKATPHSITTNENSGENAVNKNIITDTQRQAVIKKESELIELTKEYDEVRSDPEERNAHRIKMQEKLAVYSKEVLPIVLEKLEAAKSEN